MGYAGREETSGEYEGAQGAITLVNSADRKEICCRPAAPIPDRGYDKGTIREKS